MKLQRTYNAKTWTCPAKLERSRGFTLIEILIVAGIIVMLGGLGLFYGLDDFYAQSFHSNRDTLVSVLQHARAKAVSNVCRGNDCEDGRSHGVHIDGDGGRFVVFQVNPDGTPDEDSFQIFEANKNIIYEGDDEIIFKQLSGDVAEEWEITLEDPNSHRTSTISINTEGQILWTN